MSHKDDGILDSLKHLVFEEEPEAPKVPHGSNSAPRSNPAISAPIAIPDPVTTPVPDSDELYQRLLAKTDFDQTEVGRAIRKFLDPLADLPMDAALKFKTAVAQARAQLGLSEGSITGAFDGLSQALQKEQETFALKEQQFAAREVNGRQERISQITDQMAKLRDELSELSTSLMDAQTKGANAHAQFAAAVHRRANEIDQQKAQYAALLK